MKLRFAAFALGLIATTVTSLAQSYTVKDLGAVAGQRRSCATPPRPQAPGTPCF